MGPALALRTMNVAFIAATVFLLADMGRGSPRAWPISRAVGWWAAFAWILLADVWTGNPMLPWSSTLAAMLSVATLYLLTRSMRYSEEGHTRAASIVAFSGGVVLGLIVFTRINVGLSAMGVCLLAAGLIRHVERDTKRIASGLFIVGTLSSFLSVIVILASTSSLTDFYYQFIGPQELPDAIGS
jgi:hypothetical protein